MTQSIANWGRYAELKPEQLEAIRAEAPIAYVPWGALEWHGPHLPLGLDGMTAEATAERCAQRTGGVLLPTTWWPITALPHPTSLSINTKVIRSLWDEIFDSLAAAGWKVVVLLSGHYAQGHELILMTAAEEAIRRRGLLALALPPLALVDEEMLDHAALWETSLLLALRPKLVDLDALGSGPIEPAHAAVLGRDPRGTASASLGEKTLTLAVERISKAVNELITNGDPAPLHAFYERRRAQYRSYVEKYYRGSFEEAIQTWWQERTGQ